MTSPHLYAGHSPTQPSPCHLASLPGFCYTLQAVGATPESVLLLDSPQAGKDGTDEGAGSGALFLQVGLVNGVLLRTEVDRATGQLRWVPEQQCVSGCGEWVGGWMGTCAGVEWIGG